ncbi:SWIM zinc finger family protein [Plantactinospora sonchi]|uniref:SWIM zinc finger family protein n=1 Tax=Plantactinospora sonchi TaxID=1544735 RepID=A0ABU7S0F4_9ACTN
MSGPTGRADFADYGPRRRVSGGLRARSTRGTIGQSWWSRRFVDVLESFALGTRLTRGRSYARSGQVLSLEVAPGEVTAVVQGSRPQPYAVSIRLRPFPEPLWTRVETLLAAQALFSARLLAGDVPPELEQVFADAGAPLFPGAVDELEQRCNCPDFAVPCKHLAATFYLLAEAFDADPFQLLHWRGRDRRRLLARLRTLRTGESTADPTGDGADPTGAADPSTGREGRRTNRRSRRTGAEVSDPGVEVAATTDPSSADTATASPVGTGMALADLPATSLAEVADRFWVSPVPLPSRAPVLATGPGLVLRQLGPPGAAIGGPGLAERLARAYTRFDATED